MWLLSKKKKTSDAALSESGGRAEVTEVEGANDAQPDNALRAAHNVQYRTELRNSTSRAHYSETSPVSLGARP